MTLLKRFAGAALLACFFLLAGCEADSEGDSMSDSDSLSETKENPDQTREPSAAVASDAMQNQVRVGIRPVENQVTADQPIEILFYLSNDTDEAIEVLPWATPLEQPISADLFVVSSNGEQIPYAGRVVKRAAPTADNYLTIEPGEQRESVVKLSMGYDMRSAGEYLISLERIYLQDADGEIDSAIADSTVTVVRQ